MAGSKPRGGRDAGEGCASLARMGGGVCAFSQGLEGVRGSLRLPGTNRGASMLEFLFVVVFL